MPSLLLFSLTILEPALPSMGGTMGTAEDLTLRLHPVANDAAITMLTDRSQGMDGAFKAVKNMWLTVESHREGFVVNVSAGFAGGSVVHGIGGGVQGGFASPAPYGWIRLTSGGRNKLRGAARGGGA